MSCLDVKIQSYPVGQSSFTEKVLIYEIKKNNGMYGTKRFENETERFGDGTKRFENETKRFGNGTKRFENGTLLRCSSALQGL